MKNWGGKWTTEKRTFTKEKGKLAWTYESVFENIGERAGV